MHATEQELELARKNVIIPPTIMLSNNKKFILPMWLEYRSEEQFEELTQEFEKAREEARKKAKKQTLTKVEEWDVPSSKGDKTYKVRYDGVEWTCTCSGFQFRKRCSHIEAKKKEI